MNYRDMDPIAAAAAYAVTLDAAEYRAEPEAFRHWSGVFRREGGA